MSEPASDLVVKPRRSQQVKILDAPGLPSGKVLKHEISKEYYEVGEDVLLLWQLMDGSRTVPELVGVMRERGQNVKENYVQGVLGFLEDEGLIHGTEPPRTERTIRIESPLEINVVVLPDSAEAFRTWYRYLKPFLNRYSLVSSISLILIGALVFSGQFASILGDGRNFLVLDSAVIGFLFYFLVILHPITWLHEYAHATVLAKYGGEPAEIGIGLYYFSPMFYVDTSDSIRLRARERIMVSLAGPLVDLMFGSLFALLNQFFPSQIFKMGAFFIFYGALFTFLPLIENDGYYAFTDLLGKPDLRQDAIAYIKSKFRLGDSDRDTGKLSFIEKFNLLFYGTLVVIFSGFLIFVSLFFFSYMTDDALESLNVIVSALLGNYTPGTVIVRSVGLLFLFSVNVVGFGAFVFNSLRHRVRHH